jgi:VWFA-related protein
VLAQTPLSDTIQVTSRIVYVDVVVRDHAGHIVRGLTESDFRIFEDGKPQKITYFADHTHDPAAKDPAKPKSGDLEFSNVDFTSNSVNIILFDFLNTAPQDQLYARKQMIRFLQALPPGQQTALFVLSSRLQMLQSFTGSTDRLLAAANKMKPKPSSVETVGQQQQGDDFVAAVAAAIGRSPSAQNATADQNFLNHGEDEVMAAVITQTAMQQIAAAVSGYPGRKNLYWLADNFPLYGGPALEIHEAADAMIHDTMNTQYLAQANRAEGSAQIAIYPISLQGLDASGMGAEASGMTSTQQLFTARVAMHEMLNNMADSTGGRAYYGTNDFAGALQRGFEDGASYYSLAIEPPNRTWNGAFRKISVKLAEHGYSLSYRRGYYTQPDSPSKVPAATYLNAAMQPDTPQASVIRLRAVVQLPDRNHPDVRVDSVIDPVSVNFSNDLAGRHHANLLVSLIALPEEEPGKKPANPVQVSGMYVVNLDSNAFAKLLASGMSMRHRLRLAPGNYRLRLGVIDLNNNRVGTLDMPIRIAATGPS